MSLLACSVTAVPALSCASKVAANNLLLALASALMLVAKVSGNPRPLDMTATRPLVLAAKGEFTKTRPSDRPSTPPLPMASFDAVPTSELTLDTAPRVPVSPLPKVTAPLSMELLPSHSEDATT